MFILAIFFGTWTAWGESNPPDVHLQYAIKGETAKIIRVLDLNRRDADRRRVYLFDSYRLDFYHHNVQIRIRIEEDNTQLAVKQWGLSPSEYEHLQKTLGTCEIDVHGPVAIRACGVKSKISLHEAELVLRGRSVFSIMTEAQTYLLTHAKIGMELFGEIVPLGPIESLAWSWKDTDNNKYGIDIQEITGESVFRELTVKTQTSESIHEWQRWQKELQGRGLSLARRQHGRRLEKLTGLVNCALALQD